MHLLTYSHFFLQLIAVPYQLNATGCSLDTRKHSPTSLQASGSRCIEESSAFSEPLPPLRCIRFICSTVRIRVAPAFPPCHFCSFCRFFLFLNVLLCRIGHV
eukprot:GHVT01025893.1.p1 GENE.GHVT01025893.1~~GHVT01025893.1.p1  ORF type:complete len:102 (+),score=0.01 GHVT01025893.1:505-810(+)